MVNREKGVNLSQKFEFWWLLLKSESIFSNYTVLLFWRTTNSIDNFRAFSLAILKFKILKTYNSFTHAEILISTGRMHQIRVQSANLNHPILNDKKYGLFSLNKYIAKETSISRLALHARSISFSDLGGNNVSYEAPKNNEFDILLSKLDNLTVKF